MNNYNFHIFGLTFDSSIEIPGLNIEVNNNPDVFIRYGTVPDHLENVISSGVLFESSNEEFLLKVPNVGSYCVRNGNQIIVEPNPNATLDEVRLFLMGSVFGALLFQKGYTPLHGSSNLVNGKATIIIGSSAAGKSTLAAALAQSGYPLISDDLSAITIRKSKCVMERGIPFLKLWEDSKNKLFPEFTFKRVRPQINKYSIPSKYFHHSTPDFEVQNIVNLKVKNSPGIISNRIKGAHKLAILREHIFRGQYIKGSNDLDRHFKLLATLANQSKVYIVERPSLPLDIVSLIDTVINEIKSD